MSRFDGYSQYIGFLVPDERIKNSNLLINDGGVGNSSYTEAGRRAGRPEYDRAETAVTSTTAGDLGPSMSLESTGAQADVDYHVKALKGGMPGDQCEVIYRPATSGDTPWRGHQSHNVAAWHYVDGAIDRGIAPSTGAVNYACCPTADYNALFVYANTGSITARIYNPGPHTLGSAITIADHTAGINADAASYRIAADDLLVDCLLLPSGRLLVYAITAEIYTTGAGNRTLWMWYSDDNGATWRSGNYLALDRVLDSTSATLLRLRAVYSNDAVMLLIEKSWEGQGTEYGIVQFASDDIGTNFVMVEDWEDQATERGRYFDLISDPATGIITCVYYDTTGTNVVTRRVTSPFSPLLSVPKSTVTSTNVTNIKAWSDVDGKQYATWANTEDIEMAVSVDGGATWTQYGTDPFDSGNASNVYDEWDACSVQAKTVWCVADTAGGLTDHKFLVVETGGWNTLVQPRVAGVEPTELRGFGGGSGRTWLPFRLPSAYFWNAQGAGSKTLQTTAPYGVQIGSAGNTSYYDFGTGAAVADGDEVFWTHQINSGSPALTSTQCGVQMFIGDGSTQDWKLSVNFSTTQVRMRDLVAGADIGTASVDTSTTRKVFKLAFRNTTGTSGSATLYVRDPDSDVWTTLITTGSLTRNTTAPASSTVLWGHVDSGTVNSDWHFVHFTNKTGEGIATRYFDDLALNTIANDPFVLYGARLPSPPYRLAIDQGLFAHGVSGPALRGDTWKVVPSYDHPISALDTVNSASPAETWRSASDGTLVRIAWEPSAGQNTHPGNSTYGIAVVGANIQTAMFRGWNGAAWVDIVQLRFHQEMIALDYTRSGDTIQVDTGATITGPLYVGLDELAGATVDLGSSKVRGVLRNTEGAWTDQTTKRPILTLDGIDGTEPASGTLEIRWPEAVSLIHDDLTHYSRYAIEIPVQTTAEGYFEIGGIIIGPAVIFGTKYSRNRAVTTAPNYDLYTATNGARSARKLGPGRRTVSASWVEGFDATNVQQASPVPDYVSARSGTDAFAARGDAYVLEGMVRRVGGATVPVVYIPKIPTPDSSGPDQDVTRLAGRERMVYGRIMNPVSREVVLGEENLNEVVRVSGLTLEEEV